MVQGEEDLDEGELQSIVQEAEAPFGSERVFLASDYFSFRVGTFLACFERRFLEFVFMGLPGL